LIKRAILTITFLLLFILPVNANILPNSKNDISPDAMGLYQMPLRITVYALPDKKSDIIYEANWDYKTFNASKGNANNIFSVWVQDKELAYAQVTDTNEDWCEIIYDKASNKKGWIITEDLRFMPWRSFYNTYGRKYGLFMFKDSPASIKDLKSSTDDNSQIVQKIEKPLKINLTKIKGNWALITAIENNSGKTGYLRWRSDDGELYAFPAIK